MATPESELLIPFIRSCEKETTEPIEGTVTGNLPQWLRGTLIRNGAGLMHVGDDKYNHIFDGLALLRQFTIKDGQVTYRNKFLRSHAYRQNMKANRIVVREFATPAAPDPCKTIFQRLFSLFSFDEIMDNDLINVARFTDEYYAMSETDRMWRIDPETLEALQSVSISQFVPVKLATAHAHEDTDGTMYNIGSSFTPGCNYTIFKVPPKESASSNAFERAKVVCSIPATQRFSPGYYHSFGMSENYFIFVEQSLRVSFPVLLKSHFFPSTAIEDCVQWRPENKPRFFVARRDNGEILPLRYTANPFMVFHHINAYEDDGHLVVDMCCYEDGSVVKKLYVEALRSAAKNPEASFIQSQAKRYVLPLALGDVRHLEKNLVRIPGCTAKAVVQEDGTIFCEPETITRPETWYTELPRINYGFNGRKYQYFYSFARKMSDAEEYLVKVNVQDGSTVSWHSCGEIPSEPVFVASKDPKNEDDGVILASLLSKTDVKKVSLVVLDAASMTELARAAFTTESFVPADFHGLFIEK